MIIKELLAGCSFGHPLLVDRIKSASCGHGRQHFSTLFLVLFDLLFLVLPHVLRSVQQIPFTIILPHRSRFLCSHWRWRSRVEMLSTSFNLKGELNQHLILMLVSEELILRWNIHSMILYRYVCGMVNSAQMTRLFLLGLSKNSLLIFVDKNLLFLFT